MLTATETLVNQVGL